MVNSEENTAGDEIETGGNAGMNRRNLIKTGAAVGAAAWVLPQVVSMSAAAAASPITPPGCLKVPYAANFNGLANTAGGNYQTYSGVGTALTNGWVTAPGTDSVDAVVSPPYGNGFTDPSPEYPQGASSSAPVLIDLLGSPGPGGITTTLTLCPSTNYTLTFERQISDSGTFTLTITDPGNVIVPVVYGGNNASAVTETVPFTTTTSTAVTVTFFSAGATFGNQLLSNIRIL